METRNFSATERAKRYEQLNDERHDIFSRRWGNHRCRDCARCGISWNEDGCMEMQDFAAGTSSRSNETRTRRIALF